MEQNPWRQISIAVVEDDALGEDVAHHADHVVDLERRLDLGVEHVAPGGEGHFTILQVKIRFRELVKIADVVVMKVGDDHVLDGFGVDADKA